MFESFISLFNDRVCVCVCVQVVRVSPRRWLNLQEYQSKKLMQDSGVTVQRFFVADTAAEALEAAKRLSKWLPALEPTWRRAHLAQRDGDSPSVFPPYRL